MSEIKRLPRWDYRYELINFQRHDNGSVSYQTRGQGKILYGYEKPFESSRLLLRTWKTARSLAEKTHKDVVIYVLGKRIIPRIRTVRSTSFW